MKRELTRTEVWFKQKSKSTYSAVSPLEPKRYSSSKNPASQSTINGNGTVHHPGWRVLWDNIVTRIEPIFVHGSKNSLITAKNKRSISIRISEKYRCRLLILRYCDRDVCCLINGTGVSTWSLYAWSFSKYMKSYVLLPLWVLKKGYHMTKIHIGPSGFALCNLKLRCCLFLIDVA